MTERKYSVSEIDNMRRSLKAMWGEGTYDAVERATATEERLRTHMLNGTEPEELRAEADRLSRDRWAAKVAAGKAGSTYDENGNWISSWSRS